MTPVIAPILHLNGDRPETLMTALEDAYTVLEKAINAVHETAPHGRNYYPQPGLFDQARAQYETRIEQLKAVRESLIQEYKATDVQRTSRK